MGSDEQGKINLLLRAAAAGDEAAEAELFSCLYDRLRRRAHALMRPSVGAQTLQATALIGEAYLKLANHGNVNFHERGHFLAVMSRAMRQVLVDHARKRSADKRCPPGKREPLDHAHVRFEERAISLLDLDDALRDLAKVDPMGARIVDLKFFGGLETKEIARVLDRSVRSVERDWRAARAWLYGVLT